MTLQEELRKRAAQKRETGAHAAYAFREVFFGDADMMDRAATEIETLRLLVEAASKPPTL